MGHRSLNASVTFSIEGYTSAVHQGEPHKDTSSGKGNVPDASQMQQRQPQPSKQRHEHPRRRSGGRRRNHQRCHVMFDITNCDACFISSMIEIHYPLHLPTFLELDEFSAILLKFLSK